MGTQKQFILNFSVHSRAGDTSCLKGHLQQFKSWLGSHPKSLVADAGYGSEENYCYLEENQITAYVKDNRFYYEQKRNYKKKRPYRAENYPYHPELDEYECPQKKRLRYPYTKPYKSENEFVAQRRIYECDDCSQCPVKTECTRAKNNRQIQIGVEWERFKRQAHDNLLSPQGLVMRSRCPVEVEAVFGRLKQDWDFRRFLLRGIKKVTTEWGILSIAHNLAKAAIA